MSELISAAAKTAGELFTKDSALQYRVPAFQRPFSWNKGNVDDLWDDLHDAINYKRNHFLGSVVLQGDTRKNSNTLEIYDGQQRLTVVTAIVAVIRHACRNIATFVSEDRQLSQRCQKLENATERFIYIKWGGKRRLRLQLSEQDKGYFRDCISDAALGEAELKSNTFLKSYVFANLTRRLKDSQATNATSEAQIQHLEDLYESVLTRLYFVSIRVDKEFSEATLFETLNVRGNPLKPHDLFKSLLYSKARKQKSLRDVQREWDGITKTLDRLKRSLTDFLRVFWVAKHARTTDHSLYRLFKIDLEAGPASIDRVRQQTFEAIDYVHEMRVTLSHYETIVAPTKQKWKNRPEIKNALDGIRLAGGDASYAFLVALLNVDEKRLRNNAAEFRQQKYQVIQAVEAFSVRIRMCEKAMSGGEIRKMYATAIGQLREDPIDGLEQFIRTLRKNLPSDTRFAENFAKYDCTSQRLFARHLLHELERAYSPRAERLSRDGREVGVEHIMPKTLGSGWALVGKYHKQFLNRLGNLTLLSSPLNKTNAGFGRKKKAYAESNVKMTKLLLGYDKWRKTEINLRQAEMAKHAVRIWRI